MGTHPCALAPSEQRVHAPLVKNDLISCSWLHLLKVWSLLKIRGDSGCFIAETEIPITSELIHWIYASSNDMEVLSPLQLREIIRIGISSALEQYRLV